MTLNIDFTPQETDWINAQAKQQGLPPEQIVRKLVDAHLQNTAGTTATAPTQPTPTLDAKQLAAIALLNSYLETEATDDPEEIRKAEEELEEFKRNMNANRAATGERLVFP
jgi:hypothetical protein